VAKKRGRGRAPIVKDGGIWISQGTERARVCHACLFPTDLKLGHVHSDLGCQRCNQAPCWGFIVETASLRREVLAPPKAGWVEVG